MEFEEKQKVLSFAVTLAKSAGDIQIKALQADYNFQKKSSQVDIVTDIDRQCERLIVDSIVDRFPDHAIIGEEGARRDASSGSQFQWVIDPLDGTTNFVHRLPVFGTSIALFHGEEAILGVVHSAVLQRTYTAISGHGSFLNGKPLHVSGTSELSSALVASGIPYDRAISEENNINYISHISPMVRGLRRLGSAALDLCFVAEGVYDAYWELKVELWDIAAGALIADEAGASSRYVKESHGKYNVLSANPDMYPKLLRELQQKGDSFSKFET